MSIRYGKKGEDTWTSELADEIRKRGLGATAFPMFHVVEGGRRSLSKPDIEITDGGVSVGSAKIGEAALIKALSTAQEYQVKLQRAEELRSSSLREVFAITYPAGKGERFHLIALPRPWRARTLTYAVDELPELAASIESVVRGREPTTKEIPLSEEAPRLLYWGARELADSIRGSHQEELEQVFGGHDFFNAVLATKLAGKERGDTLRLGAAFLFVNQIFFYVLLSREDQERGKGTEYPPIADEDMAKPERLLSVYFKKVHDKNYEPIYGTVVAPLFKGTRAAEACAEVVRAIIALAPGIGKRDLAGQVFQTLIPSSVRKPLGAHYTNPRAAELLAGLAVRRWDDRVMDPACGSGTLLVAAYHRKMLMAVSQGRNPEVMHKAFVEREITGLDAMAFAAHLAAVNLALQHPLLDTEHVRIATTDSTMLKPGASLERTEDSLPGGMRDARLDFDFKKPRRRKGSGPVQMKRSKVRGFAVGKVDVVIMNPPFTRWSTMAESYREAVRERFEAEGAPFSDLIVKRPGQHLFFMLLGELFLDENGRVAAVIPQSTFHEAAYQNWVRHFVENYSITALVVGLGRASFSEQSALSECLVVATKTPPAREHEFALVGTLRAPETWSIAETEQIIERVGRGANSHDELAVVRHFRQTELIPGGQTLPALCLRLIEAYEEGIASLSGLDSVAGGAFQDLAASVKEESVDFVRGIETAEHFSFYGPKALLACRLEEGAGQVDRLIIGPETASTIRLRDRMTGKTYDIDRKDAVPALRSIADYSQMNITGQADLAIINGPPAIEQAMKDFYEGREAQRFLSRVRLQNRWNARVAASSSRLLLFRRGNLSASGTRLLSFWSERPVLQAGVNYAVRGLTTAAEEKLWCLWFNSTPFLLKLLGHVSATEGAFVTLEGFGLERLPVPRLASTRGVDATAIDAAFTEIGLLKFPSLLEQLQTHHESRVMVDDAMLRFLGVRNQAERKSQATIMRNGAASAIQTLMQTMGG